MARREVPAYAALLRRARSDRGWSRPRLAYELARVMREGGQEPPGHESLVRMLRAWENGEHRPDDHNREQLAKVLGVEVAAIGERGAEVGSAAGPPAVAELKTAEFVAWIAEHSARASRRPMTPWRPA
jgi:transcriptional regulator with XRE-family HTH domain